MMSWITENQHELIVIIIGIGLGILIYYFRFYRRRVFFCSTSFNIVNTNSAHSYKLNILFENSIIINLTVTRKPKNSFYVWPLAIAVIDILDGMFFNFGAYNIITFLLTIYGYIVLIILSPIFFCNWKNILPDDLYKSFVSEN